MRKRNEEERWKDGMGGEECQETSVTCRRGPCIAEQKREGVQSETSNGTGWRR